MASYSGFSMFFPLKMVIFHSYVSLPEGNNPDLVGGFNPSEKYEFVNGNNYPIHEMGK